MEAGRTNDLSPFDGRRGREIDHNQTHYLVAGKDKKDGLATTSGRILFYDGSQDQGRRLEDEAPLESNDFQGRNLSIKNACLQWVEKCPLKEITPNGDSNAK